MEDPGASAMEAETLQTPIDRIAEELKLQSQIDEELRIQFAMEDSMRAADPPAASPLGLDSQSSTDPTQPSGPPEPPMTQLASSDTLLAAEFNDVLIEMDDIDDSASADEAGLQS